MCGSAGDPLGQRLGEAGLADARLGRNQHHPPVARLRLRPAAEQQLHLLVAADQRRGAGAQRLEPAERAVLGHDAPGALRLGKALERLRPEVRALEQRADLPARALGNHDGVGLGQRLQPGREVRRLADDRLLLRRAGADQVADDHQPGGDADAHLQAFRRL